MSKVKLPRFQFFYSLRLLIKQKIKIYFDNLNFDHRSILFEKKIGKYFNRKFCLTTSSYRTGLFYTLKSLGLDNGDEVLLTSITIPDTINAILINGLTPIFVDLDLDTHSMDFNKIESKITKKTKVLLVTYLSGMIPDIKKYQEICNKHGLVFIEDFSQNFEAKLGNVLCGSMAEISIGSLSCGKILSTFTGGIILLNNDEMFKKIKKTRDEVCTKPSRRVLNYYLNNCIAVTLATMYPIFNFFTFNLLCLISKFTKDGIIDFEHEPKHKHNIFYTFIPVKRLNFPKNFHTWLSGWQADMGLILLDEIHQGTNKRRELAKVLLANLSKEALLLVPKGLRNVDECSYYHFPIFCYGQKKDLRKYLFENGIDNGSYGLNMNHGENCFSFPKFNDLKNTEIIKNDTIFIPINEKYSKESMLYVADLLNQFSSLNSAKFKY